MSDNLPDDVTPQDIDDNFGDPGGVEVTGVAVVQTTVEITGWPTRAEKRKAIKEAVEDGEVDLIEVPQMDERRFDP